MLQHMCCNWSDGVWPDQALAEEKARLAHEREMEVARLRDAQEKILNRRSEMDELRARRSGCLTAHHDPLTLWTSAPQSSACSIHE